MALDERLKRGSGIRTSLHFPLPSLIFFLAVGTEGCQVLEPDLDDPAGWHLAPSSGPQKLSCDVNVAQRSLPRNLRILPLTATKIQREEQRHRQSSGERKSPVPERET